MDDENIIKHESFGVLQVSKVQGTRRSLFGSSIEHNHFIALRICPATLKRHLNRDWISDVGSIPYIEVMMSYNQFAEAITSFNQGSGTPVTIDRINGKQVAEFVPIGKPEEFKQEITSMLSNTVKEISEFKSKLTNARVSEKLRIELVRQFDRVRMQIEDNIPFVERQFHEQMEKTIVEAKSEFEGFVQGRIRDLGLEKLKFDTKLAIESKDDRDRTAR